MRNLSTPRRRRSSQRAVTGRRSGTTRRSPPGAPVRDREQAPEPASLVSGRSRLAARDAHTTAASEKTVSGDSVCTRPRPPAPTASSIHVWPRAIGIAIVVMPRAAPARRRNAQSPSAQRIVRRKALPARAMAARVSWRFENARSAAAMAFGRVRARPATHRRRVTMSRVPADAVATTGTPHAMASIKTLPNPS